MHTKRSASCSFQCSALESNPQESFPLAIHCAFCRSCKKGGWYTCNNGILLLIMVYKLYMCLGIPSSPEAHALYVAPNYSCYNWETFLGI